MQSCKMLGLSKLTTCASTRNLLSERKLGPSALFSYFKSFFSIPCCLGPRPRCRVGALAVCKAKPCLDPPPWIVGYNLSGSKVLWIQLQTVLSVMSTYQPYPSIPDGRSCLFPRYPLLHLKSHWSFWYPATTHDSEELLALFSVDGWIWVKVRITIAFWSRWHCVGCWVWCRYGTICRRTFVCIHLERQR